MDIEIEFKIELFHQFLEIKNAQSKLVYYPAESFFHFIKHLSYSAIQTKISLN